jgi:hypothetical protein
MVSVRSRTCRQDICLSMHGRIRVNKIFTLYQLNANKFLACDLHGCRVRMGLPRWGKVGSSAGDVTPYDCAELHGSPREYQAAEIGTLIH